MKKNAGLLLLAGTLTLTGCASPTALVPDATPLGRVSTIEEVRDAFIEAGGVCNWEQTDRVTNATASGECSERTVLMLFADRADVEETVATLQSIKLADRDLTLLVGENWIVNSPEAENLQAVLGGEWVTE